MKHNWQKVKDYNDITYDKLDGIARIAFDRPEVRNAFRPETVKELHEALIDAREDSSIGVILLTGNGPAKDGKYSLLLNMFSSLFELIVYFFTGGFQLSALFFSFKPSLFCGLPKARWTTFFALLCGSENYFFQPL